MADRRDLRQRVIAVIENSFSASEAGWRCHVSLRTVQRWAHKFQNYREFQRCYSIVRPRCLTRAEDKAVCRVNEENLFRSTNQIRAVANFLGTSWTVTNHLRNENIHCRRAASKESLREGQDHWLCSLRNRLEGFRLGKHNLHWRNTHLLWLWMMWTCLSWARHQIWHTLYPTMLEVGMI